MLVIYRMCGIPSTNPSPILQEDKFALNTLCLRSFVKAFKQIKPKIVFINDFCDKRYSEMIDRIVPFDKNIYNTELGIDGTCIFSYELASKSDDNVFLFQECDYYYRPEVGLKMFAAIKEFGLFSPYDHPDFYNRYDIHPRKIELNILNNEHFRTAKRNTMTFGMTKDVFSDSKDILDKYGYLDNEVWTELSDRGHKLYTPIPAYATHMVRDYLAPGIDWESLWLNTQS